MAASAYRAGVELTNERDGLTHDFSRRDGVRHSEIVLPTGIDAAWAEERAQLWNTAEFAEARKDARTAREFEIALPHELTDEQRIEATRQFAKGLAERYDAAVDFAIHAPHDEADVRNHHAHVLMTTRTVGPDGLGDKTLLELSNKKLQAQGLPTTQAQLKDIRQMWEDIGNERLAEAGLDVRIDHRSHRERGLEIEPTQHMGVHATQMERRGLPVDRSRLDGEAARRNAELIREKPEEVLTIITGEKSVFDRHDIARTLHRYIDRSDEFQAAMAKVIASKSLVQLQGEGSDGSLARYSTKEMVALEEGMAESADRMADKRDHGVAGRHVRSAIEKHDRAIQVQGGRGLSDEQKTAIEHVTGSECMACVIGTAGAGKSTMLAAAREAWEKEDRRVFGGTLAGKAAEGLEESSGIQSRTLASWDIAWKNGHRQLQRGDVLVIDEAGMVGSRQMARFVSEAEGRGAKLVLVGDHEQLQAIGAGAAFRAIAERTGAAELQDVRRQREDWQRQASQDFARHRTDKGLAAYAERGELRFSKDAGEAQAAIVRDYLDDCRERPGGTRAALAHRRVDVQALNQAIREARQQRGELAGEIVYQTRDGKRAFAPGDRILFMENNRELNVKNGMLGTVQAAESGRITALIDGQGVKRQVSVSIADYAAIDHGYATTIHKSQGATVDRAFVMASPTMDRHLTYVAMTRHRDQATLYAGSDEFKDMTALSTRLGRSRAKETTLDYAQRRGMEDKQLEADVTRAANSSELDRAFGETGDGTAQAESRKYGRRFGFRKGAERDPVQRTASRDRDRSLDRDL